MRKSNLTEYIAPQIDEVSVLTEQFFAASALFEADHEGFGYYDDETNN